MGVKAWGVFIGEHWLLCLMLAGAVLVGVALMAGWTTAIEFTNNTKFCITCHVMRDTVYAEYQNSAHFKNAQGVVVGCPDCHVPQYDWVAEVGVKIRASTELYDFFVRGINTPEAFARERPALAKAVWAHFYETNARECRHCHDYNNMVLAKQSPAAQLVHPVAMKTNANCLDCHKGVVHHIPPGSDTGSKGG